jgi:hypothetical protein
MRVGFCILLLSSYGVASELTWPTPSGRPTGGSLSDFVQPTISGRTESGLFGMTRNDGSRFHEGIDIQPGWVDANDEPVDPISAVMPGQIAYIERSVRGPYGRYVVIEHPAAELPVYTLYAHLASIDGGIRVGANVVSGQVLGRMGHTSAGIDPISVDRSHLHFEIGLRLSDNFNRWYNQQPEFRGDPNVHGNYNGLNLAGFDPLPILLRSRSDFHMVVNNLPNALVVVARTSSIPDFVRKYPQLSYGTAKNAAGWRIDFTWHGLPRRWTALMAGDPTIPPSGWRIDRVYENYRGTLEQRKMLEPGRTIPGETLRRTMGVLLGP